MTLLYDSQCWISRNDLTIDPTSYSRIHPIDPTNQKHTLTKLYTFQKAWLISSGLITATNSLTDTRVRINGRGHRLLTSIKRCARRKKRKRTPESPAASNSSRLILPSDRIETSLILSVGMDGLSLERRQAFPKHRGTRPAPGGGRQQVTTSQTHTAISLVLVRFPTGACGRRPVGSSSTTIDISTIRVEATLRRHRGARESPERAFMCVRPLARLHEEGTRRISVLRGLW